MGAFRKLNPCSCRACISGFKLQAYKAAQERFSSRPELLKGCKYIMNEKNLFRAGGREKDAF
ncbi:predicted protein [Methanosarcina acetivorans C2A]|uniref:Uncharacterized protein n=1 Tax=Methanosarcina acetivorans (strain ATCC 35395 / DSM 2834 / JCM 12185 / C2A) TaxID=188937 RepID=Q8TJQ5_METAC|nr:predicted protein [Methanosarcina acetivorans C2A]